jgi:NAD-dependent dihydropyrimidine dehydrogenase PreA subunit
MFMKEVENMSAFYVIAEPCIDVKDKSCVEVCPVDCIHGDEESRQLFINPDECIICGRCEIECPVAAIYEEDALPTEWKHYIQLNAAYFHEKTAAS